jgi:hypothetical protein
MLSLRRFIPSFCMSPCSSEHIFSRGREPGFRGEAHPFGSPCSFDLHRPWARRAYMRCLVRDCLMAGETMRVSPFIPVCVQEFLPAGPLVYIALVKKLIDPDKIVLKGLSINAGCYRSGSLSRASARSTVQLRLSHHPQSEDAGRSWVGYWLAPHHLVCRGSGYGVPFSSFLRDCRVSVSPVSPGVRTGITPCRARVRSRHTLLNPPLL